VGKDGKELIEEKYMKRLLLYIVAMLISGVLAGCGAEYRNGSISLCDASFFGDSTAVLIVRTLQNGYRISIIHNRQIGLVHFERGDSISQYCAIRRLPFGLRNYEEDSIGVFEVDLSFPNVRTDTLGDSKIIPEMFFMDVNFDGEEEFVVAHEGYNRTYYACFDLVNGNWSGSCPGLLESINDPPYNNIVSGIPEQPSYTVFDRKRKEIFVYESMGCCSYYKTWAKYFKGDEYGNEPTVKVTKMESHEWWADGKENIKTYKLLNDSLKLVEDKVIN